MGLRHLNVRNCPSLEEWLYMQMEIMWRRSSNEKLRSIGCSFVQAYIDYDGKPFKILHLHPRSPLWTESSDDKPHPSFSHMEDNNNGMKMIKIKPTELELDEEKLMDWIQLIQDPRSLV
ncbi:hypothetical protein FH972_010219 [Carpinus fangiana]|uniref:Uncharacterized protein n=1 Tax=Carpinus fangiana TaxID=176857 RepID=A0A660KUK1_9ROSI|nr:hypothetical protein FH972_010219 [Carpinus fangiana]